MIVLASTAVGGDAESTYYKGWHPILIKGWGMEGAIKAVVEAVAGETAREAASKALGAAMERLSAGKVNALLVLTFYFDGSASWTELAGLLTYLLREAGFNESGWLNSDARVGYSYYSLCDDVIDRMSLSEIDDDELPGEYLHKLQEIAVKLTVWVELYKWKRETLRRAYTALTRVIRGLAERYQGRYTLMLMIRPPIRAALKRLKVAFQDEEVITLVVDPLDFEQEEELLKLPPRW